MRRGLFGEINAVLFIAALKRAADFRGKGAGNIEKPRPSVTKLISTVSVLYSCTSRKTLLLSRP